MLNPTVLVVGGGLTGAAVSRVLCRSLPAESVVVWEAASAIGGRFATERPVSGGACDTGAQYMTVTDDAVVASANAALYDELKADGTISPLSGRIQGGRAADGTGTNFVAPGGLSSVVAKLFASCGVAPTCSRRALSLRRADKDGSETAEVAGSGWEVATECGHTQHFDAVVLTQPVPEMLELLDGGSGEAGQWLDAPGAGLARTQLSALQYSSRYALSLFFSPAASSTFDANIDWVARYINKDEDDALVYIAYDSAKRGGGAPAATEPASLIAHTSVPYGIKNLKAGTAEREVEADLTRRVRQLLPWLPESQHAVLRTWGISQVRTPLVLPDQASCWRLGSGDAPPLILAGDAFSPLGSRFDGCIQSGEAAAKVLLAALGK